MDALVVLAVLEQMKKDVDLWKLVAQGVASQVDEFLPLIAPTLGKIVEGMNNHSRGLKQKNFQFWIDNGFSRQEAMLLTLDAAAAYQRALQSMADSAGKKKEKEKEKEKEKQ